MRRQLSPLMLAIVNSAIIPSLVDRSARFSFYETKSQRERNNSIKNMFFMALNMIFLPLTGLVTIDEFIELFVKNESNFIDIISKNMGSMAAFFLTYLLQVTFLSNMIQLLDLPHFMYKTIVGGFMSFSTDKWKDDWYFPLGYYTAYT